MKTEEKKTPKKQGDRGDEWIRQEGCDAGGEDIYKIKKYIYDVYLWIEEVRFYCYLFFLKIKTFIETHILYM